MKMKKHATGYMLICVLMIALLFALLPQTAFAADTYARDSQRSEDSSGWFEEATIIADATALYLRPTADSPTVTELSSGTRIGVFCEEMPGWYRVIFGNYRGYIENAAIFLASTDTLAGYATHDGAALHQNAAQYSTVLADISAGTALEITNIVGDWYVANCGDISGYVAKDDVELTSGKTTASVLLPGMDGVCVADMQRALYARGFFSGSVTGQYDDITLCAVQAFQTAAGLSPNGNADTEMLAVLYGDNNIASNAAKVAGIEGRVLMSTWDDINKLWKRGTTATVTDVQTGLQYTAYRFGGWWHADCEPLTAEDTAIMKQIYSGKWSWSRRPIWVTIDGVTYAASQHGMPHKCDVITGNDFDGHFCIHFNDSKIHATGLECPRHQACVDSAFIQAQ